MTGFDRKELKSSPIRKWHLNNRCLSTMPFIHSFVQLDSDIRFADITDLTPILPTSATPRPRCGAPQPNKLSSRHCLLFSRLTVSAALLRDGIH